ncbi:hypothetical protein AcW1_004246 [Taiwanofungus camphoratus]|nr:hypothetical protein AcW2_006743 [Antrodia cinnamomea]KAI0939125.1 hypothetical protein AcV5_000627 [Antrodia cinnamomea]KAI0952045.1 hypothetical protein AcV7_007969 [Antrodia cinnamomea]KAI0959422.1 hypothetical protein AcW1_004246 [Antrodia cinnamomea]
MVNNAYIVLQLASELENEGNNPFATVRERLPPAPCLLTRLPSTGFLLREAEQLAPKAVIRQLRRTPSPSPPSSPSLSLAAVDEREDRTIDNQGNREDAIQSQSESSRITSITSVLSSVSLATSKLSPSRTTRVDTQDRKSWKVPEPYEVFRAVEKKDVTFLMEVRDRAFHLLVRKHGDATPLLHAMRIGKTHQDVAIVLLGAFSRYVNNLQDDEISLPRTKMLLKALRVNLRLAIDFGLQSSQSDLIASFFQTLIMSEGDKWVSGQVADIAVALRAGTAGKPVQTADSAIRKFATKELGKAKMIAALEDYVANATADLLMMAAWWCALESIMGDPVPTYYFARDDRVYRAFVERLNQHKSDIERLLGRRLRWQIRVLRKVMEGRSRSWHGKVQLLAEEFDEGEGV